MVQLLAESLDEEDHKAEGYSAKELTSGLARLANNDKNSAIIMKYGILDYLRVLLLTGKSVKILMLQKPAVSL